MVAAAQNCASAADVSLQIVIQNNALIISAGGSGV
jgi:hypothetical protein